MNRDHERIRRQVLGLEDLEGDQRQQALQHLETCAACRHLRERLLQAEASIRDFARVPANDDDPLRGLTSLGRAQARASLAALTATRRRRGAVNLKGLATFAAATVLLAAILVPLQRQRSPLEELRVGSPLVLRGQAVLDAATEHGVSFRLRKASYPVLLHIDAAGAVRVLYPPAGAEPVLHEAGRLLLLPPPGSVPDWRASLPAGRETYLLGLAPAGGPPAIDHILGLAGGASGVGREEVATRVRQRLQVVCSHVERLDAPARR